jgi:hypothetical protein
VRIVNDLRIFFSGKCNLEEGLIKSKYLLYKSKEILIRAEHLWS